jgi:hypothetical protein
VQVGEQGLNNMTAVFNELGYWSLCSMDCRVKILRRWLRVHFEEAARLGAGPC